MTVQCLNQQQQLLVNIAKIETVFVLCIMLNDVVISYDDVVVLDIGANLTGR